MLEDLVSKISSIEFEESEGCLYIEAMSWQGPSSLSLTLSVGCGDKAIEYWRVSCNWVLAHAFRNRAQSTLRLSFDHPVLWPHSMSFKELYFSSTPNDPAAVFGSLIEAHLDLVGSWFPISRFMNHSLSTIKLLSSGNGLLASGPAPVIEKFASVLDVYRVRHNSLPLRYGAITYNTERKPRAFLFDDSYVVAHDIEADKQDA